MRPPRMTTRRLMIAVAIVSVVRALVARQKRLEGELSDAYDSSAHDNAGLIPAALLLLAVLGIVVVVADSRSSSQGGRVHRTRVHR